MIVLSQGITKKKHTKTVGVEAFAKQHLSKKAMEGKTDVLFAAYSSYTERGGRPYWLLNVHGPASMISVHTAVGSCTLCSSHIALGLAGKLQPPSSLAAASPPVGEPVCCERGPLVPGPVCWRFCTCL